MTTKERWTVYPLLLLAIGLALRGDLVGQPGAPAETVSAESVVCKELIIIGEPLAADGQPPIIVHAGRLKGGGGGRIEIRDGEGADCVAIGTTAGSREGVVEFFDDQSNLVGKLGPTPAARPEPSPTTEE